MATKPIKFLELHYTMTQFLIRANISASHKVFPRGSHGHPGIEKKRGLASKELVVPRQKGNEMQKFQFIIKGKLTFRVLALCLSAASAL